MGYRIDDKGYSCATCGKRHDDREGADECQCRHGQVNAARLLVAAEQTREETTPMLLRR